ncbi:pectin lyase-like protein [Aureobasidium subglaciale]|nr:pectin lyase-like protein [Aureobasidium subglaciale]
MSTAWIIEGNDIVINGGGWQQGGIHGNGQAWYGRAAGQSNQFGRPISLSIYNSTNVSINNFAFYQPQFWSIWAQDSRNIPMTNIYINGTNTDPAGNSSKYAINVDGIDTMRLDQMKLENWTFQGGDDCFAPKGNSTNMVLQNFTYVGGGIAFGSVGQYPGHPDYITNISVTDIHVSQNVNPKYGGAHVAAGAYFKSWVGVAMGNPPQGGGGGTGRVSNVTFQNLVVHNTTQAVYINKCYFKVPAQGAYCDSSTFEFQDLEFKNIKHWEHYWREQQFSCELISRKSEKLKGTAAIDRILIVEPDVAAKMDDYGDPQTPLVYEVQGIFDTTGTSADQELLETIAHRGLFHDVNDHNPMAGNTIDAMYRAESLGLEFDLRLSSDNQVLVTHDLISNRATVKDNFGGRLDAVDISLDIQPAVAPIKVNSQPASSWIGTGLKTFGRNGKIVNPDGPQKLETLDAMLSHFKNLNNSKFWLILDIQDPLIFSRAAALIQFYGLSHIIFIKFFATKAINSKGTTYNGANTCYQSAL